MFYSFEHLVARDSKFALIWRVATYNKSLKKLPRNEVLSVSVSEICELLLNRLPTGYGRHDEMKNKFSLYLIAQLMYGAVRVLERQIIILEMDARAAYESCKRLPLNFDLFTESTMDGGPPAKKSKGNKGDKRKSTIDVASAGNAIGPIHITSMDELDAHVFPGRMVALADFDAITLRDDPVFKPTGYFGDDLEILPENKMCMDWAESSGVESKETSSNQSKDTRAVMGRSQQNETLLNMDNQPVLGDQFDQLLANRSRQENTMDFNMQPIDPLRQSFFEIGLDANATNAGLVSAGGPSFLEMNHKDPIGKEDSQRQSAGEESSSGNKAPPLRHMPSLELDKLDHVGLDLETPRAKRRRLVIPSYDRESTQISYASMKEMMSDYSSLVRPMEELRVDRVAASRMTAAQLLVPWPSRMGKHFPTELRTLYRSCQPEKLSFEDAMQMDPFAEVNRGDNLWKYEDSQDQETDSNSRLRGSANGDRASPGIAFCRDTPDRYLDEAENSQLDALRNGTGLVGNDMLPPLDLDAPFPQQALARPSGDLADFALPEESGMFGGRKSSILETEFARRKDDGRQSNNGSNFGRHSSVILHDGPLMNASGLAGILDAEPGQCNVDKAHNVKLAIRKAISKVVDGGAVAFSRVFPPHSVNRKAAARAFASLLQMTKERTVRVEQDSWCSEIWMLPGDVPDEEEDDLLSEGNMDDDLVSGSERTLM